MSENFIPEITDPKGRFWRQPPKDRILVDNDFAVMTTETFKSLPEYSCSCPSGVYPGRMWKAQFNGTWYLRWYGPDDGDPRGLLTPTREILLA